MDQTTIFIKNILIVIIILFTVLYVPKFNYKILNTFEKIEVRVLIILAIYLVGIYDPLIALLMSMCFVRSHIKLQHYLKYKNIRINDKTNSKNYNNEIVNLNIDNIEQLNQLKNDYGNVNNLNNHDNHDNLNNINNNDTYGLNYDKHNDYELDNHYHINNQDDPMNNQDDPMNNQDDPMNNQADPMNNQDDPMNNHADPMNNQADPMNNQADPMNNQADPMNNQAENGSIVDELADKLKITNINKEYLPYDQTNILHNVNTPKKDNKIENINNSPRLNVFENFVTNF